MKDLDLTTLRLFVEVCDARSIKRVAQREQVDASSITKRIAKLEDQIKIPLLKRVRQGVQATPEGAVLSEQARRLVKDAQKIADSLNQRNTYLKGQVTIASHMSSMSSVLADDLAAFMRLHVNRSVQLRVKEGLSKDVVQMVRDGSASVGVVWDNTETIDLQHVHYYRDKLVAVMSANHPLAKQEGIRYEELVEHDLIADKHTLHTQAKLERSGGIIDGNARFLIEVDNNHSAIRMAAHGIGVYVCQAKIAQIHAQNLDIAIVPLIGKWADLRIKLVFASNLLNPIAKHLLEHLANTHPEISQV
jgi:DNA-binding transcriptional LysR family regulator